MSIEKFRPDPDLSIEIPTEKFRPSSGNIFIDQAERANPTPENLKSKLDKLTQEIGALEEKRLPPDYMLSPKDAATSMKLSKEKDELTKRINAHPDKQSGYDRLSGAREETIFKRKN